MIRCTVIRKKKGFGHYCRSTIRGVLINQVGRDRILVLLAVPTVAIHHCPAPPAKKEVTAAVVAGNGRESGRSNTVHRPPNIDREERRHSRAFWVFFCARMGPFNRRPSSPKPFLAPAVAFRRTCFVVAACPSLSLKTKKEAGVCIPGSGIEPS